MTLLLYCNMTLMRPPSDARRFIRHRLQCNVCGETVQSSLSADDIVSHHNHVHRYVCPPPSFAVNAMNVLTTRVELSTAFRDVSRCYARENISARRFARGVHIARSFVELRRDA